MLRLNSSEVHWGASPPPFGPIYYPLQNRSPVLGTNYLGFEWFVRLSPKRDSERVDDTVIPGTWYPVSYVCYICILQKCTEKPLPPCWAYINTVTDTRYLTFATFRGSILAFIPRKKGKIGEYLLFENP